ncbi:MAG: hypothetical protein C0467_00985 [Planctomycetaceae bacterium]|nr:hypothetical protein [Planctomycetaceae bacterium]
MLYDGFYGSEAGGWVYPRVSDETPPWAVVLGLLLATVVVGAAWASRRMVERRPSLVIAFWLIAAFFVQMSVWSLSNVEFGTVVLSGTNGFYEVAAQHTVAEFLRDFQTISLEASFHVRANLAGKVLFFHLLRCITETPREVAWLILCISNLGGVLAYAIATDLFRDRLVGHTALLLYLFLPAKLFFFPLMNTVAPVFILLPLWMLLRFCATQGVYWLIGIGVSLYWLVLFDPLPLVTGLVFLGILGRAIVRCDLDWVGTAQVFLLVPLSFCGAAWLVSWAYGYNVIEAARFAIAHAKEFNELNNRPYDLWLFQNLIDFLVNTGIATSSVFVWLAATAMRRSLVAWTRDGWRASLAEVARADTCVVLSVLAVLLTLNGIGINRGEAIRLWIFLGVFVTMPVAAYCAHRPRLFAVIIGTALLQTCTSMSTRAFVMPW